MDIEENINQRRKGEIFHTLLKSKIYEVGINDAYIEETDYQN